MLDERRVDCPYCGASFTAMIDPGDGDTSYTQDCEICCRPIRFRLDVDPATGSIALTTARDDDA